MKICVVVTGERAVTFNGASLYAQPFGDGALVWHDRQYKMTGVPDSKGGTIPWSPSPAVARHADLQAELRPNRSHRTSTPEKHDHADVAGKPSSPRRAMLPRWRPRQHSMRSPPMAALLTRTASTVCSPRLS